MSFVDRLNRQKPLDLIECLDIAVVALQRIFNENESHKDIAAAAIDKIETTLK